MKYLILITSMAVVSASPSAFAQSAEEILRKHISTYATAALTLRLCYEAIWNIEHDVKTQRKMEDQMAKMGVDKAKQDKISAQYLYGDLDADMFDYYKARGIKRFLDIPKNEMGRATIYNAPNIPTYNENLDTYEYVSEKEFCDLAEIERQANSAVGKYFIIDNN